VMRKVVDHVRQGQGPHFIEAVTYRFMGHSMADPAHGHYRSKEEVEQERKRDPLIILKQTMVDRHRVNEEDFKRLEREVAAEVTAAVTFADESPFPAKEELYTDVYS
jgi:pyruvate dehydrogenase E1 component alpha subunit